MKIYFYIYYFDYSYSNNNKHLLPLQLSLFHNFIPQFQIFFLCRSLAQQQLSFRYSYAPLPVGQLAIALAWPKYHDGHSNKRSLQARHNFYCCIHLWALHTHTHTHSHTQFCVLLYVVRIFANNLCGLQISLLAFCLCLTNVRCMRRSITSQSTLSSPLFVLHSLVKFFGLSMSALWQHLNIL